MSEVLVLSTYKQRMWGIFRILELCVIPEATQCILQVLRAGWIVHQVELGARLEVLMEELGL